MLLYGPPGTGKSLLAAAVAHQAGATLFDLSPAATAGKYAGKAAATMVHMVRRRLPYAWLWDRVGCRRQLCQRPGAIAAFCSAEAAC